jgi:probable rRNA maturation factor
MINFNFEDTDSFNLQPERIKWLEDMIAEEGKKLKEVNYLFVTDEALLKINTEYLQHDYYTDIISFDYCKNNKIHGDIFVSLPRVWDNAKTLDSSPETELNRVLAHGILHFCGYKDKSPEDEKTMREKEDYYINKYNVSRETI